MNNSVKETVVELKNVNKHFPVNSFKGYGEVVHAMDDISFTIKRGEILSLVGESGSGKTTTANVISRLYKETAGEVIFEGKRLPLKMNRSEEMTYRKKVQMIFQDPFSSLNPTHTIYSILSRPYKIHHIAGKKNEIRELVKELLVQVGLEPAEQYIDKFPHELSGGQRQRVNIARTFAVNPELILADEPTSMLDVSIRMSIMNMMLDLKEQKGLTYVYITHDLAGARYMSQNIAVMYAGMLMELGTAQQVINETFHPYTKLLKSAAPSPEEGLKRTKLVTKGDIPSLVHPPSGCRFHPRCPYATDVCSKELPPFKKVDEGHYARCVL
ncbi:MAG TPA: ABC transporter ATP-binding protein [Thermotogota bacterium]|nr:ABC transporter ATP-binding protein [Thermotogota bacterium]HPJ88747.1 ABC transporter ATP-binding protein [Thermotogota bacterium]HPR95708.1 ABC transporter ATP-binding protein [Thermotogota bacterium]